MERDHGRSPADTDTFENLHWLDGLKDLVAKMSAIDGTTHIISTYNTEHRLGGKEQPR